MEYRRLVFVREQPTKEQESRLPVSEKEKALLLVVGTTHHRRRRRGIRRRCRRHAGDRAVHDLIQHVQDVLGQGNNTGIVLHPGLYLLMHRGSNLTKMQIQDLSKFGKQVRIVAS